MRIIFSVLIASNKKQKNKKQIFDIYNNIGQNRQKYALKTAHH